MSRLALDDTAWNSRWRTRSTGEKALLSLGLLALAVTSPDPRTSLLVLGVAMTVALAFARVPVRGYLLGLLGPASFVLLGSVVIAVHLGTVPRDAVWAWGPLSATHQSLLLAARVTARSLAAFAALLLLASTTPMTDVLAGLRRCRVPEVLIDIAGLVYRMLFSLLGATAAIMEAQRARLGYSTGRAARRSVGSLGGAVLVQAWNRAHRLEAGLAGRGYSGSLRTLGAARPVSAPFVGWTLAMLLVLAAASIASAVLR
ncbi:cobalt ECF transporter T component CbiQ [Cumulibacter manganitolerans]|uniref:cobalt ECF transporter T component CbiQ n=1 Tax=Cumulibacter manganitolerans TaxID=1884992 RepID=UPI001295E7DF|nr:cobalt ECF transporter T component CbiQ [Cumulibacter manganitolerans]